MLTSWDIAHTIGLIAFHYSPTIFWVEVRAVHSPAQSTVRDPGGHPAAALFAMLMSSSGAAVVQAAWPICWSDKMLDWIVDTRPAQRRAAFRTNQPTHQPTNQSN